MKDYVFYIFNAPSNMGGSWDGPNRKVIQCEDDQAAREKMKEINANWASVLVCFPLECEVKLKSQNPTLAQEVVIEPIIMEWFIGQQVITTEDTTSHGIDTFPVPEGSKGKIVQLESNRVRVSFENDDLVWIKKSILRDNPASPPQDGK